MIDKIKVVLMAPVLSPVAGGVSESAMNLLYYLNNNSLNHNSNVCAVLVGIDDNANPQVSAYSDCEIHAHRPCLLRAFNFSPAMGQTLARLAPDVVDVQGLWTYPSLVNLRHYRLTGKPYIVTPHGMLDPWALERSRWKKRIVRTWFEDAHVDSAACLRATSKMEAAHFRRFGLKQPIAIVPNGVHIPTSVSDFDHRGPRRVLFLSRLHPKKGLPFLLRAWSELSAHRPDWELVIAGPDESGHEAEMRRMAEQLRIPRIRWEGPVHGQNKCALYESADVFVLPSHAENFGLVVAEALAHCTPVITTRNAPWSGLHDHRCGWWIDLNDRELIVALVDATSRPRSELKAMGARGREWVKNDYSWPRIADEMRELYEWVAQGGLPPPFVVFD